MVSGLGELTASRGRQVSWQKQWQHADLEITTQEEGRFYLKVKSVKVLVAQSCLTFCDPVDCSMPVSPAHEILQARRLEGLPFPSPGDLPHPGMVPVSSVLAGGFFTTEPPGKPAVCLPTLASEPGEKLNNKTSTM